MAQSLRRKLIALDFPNHGTFNFEGKFLALLFWMPL